MDKVNDIAALAQQLISNNLISAVFSGSDGKYKKTKIRAVELQKGTSYQFSDYTEKQVFHRNFTKEELNSPLLEAFCAYSDFSVCCEQYVYSGRISKKGKLLYSVKKNEADMVIQEHNRKKSRILSSNMPQWLYELGITTIDGELKKDGERKFAQINRVVEIIDDLFKDKSCAEIIDFGCGKSYLSFLTYHYFTAIKGQKVNMTGLDLKQDVIENCNKLAQKYGYNSLRFLCGDIAEYNFERTPDLVMWLHACDTATDFAILGSVKAEAKHIVAVPCCQHEVARNQKASSLTSLMEYGIIKERISALVTDTLRAKCLEYCGYKVDLMEFVDYAVSPKNLLLRAEYVGIDELSSRRKVLRSEIVEICDWLGFVPTLPKVLGIVGKE